MVDKPLVPPTTAEAALAWTKEARRSGNYLDTFHIAIERGPERGISSLDVRNAIQRASRCEAYDRLGDHGGTCWRVFGRDAEGRMLGIGVETYVSNGKAVALCTVFKITERRKR